MLCRVWWGSCQEKFQSDEPLGQPVCSHVSDAIHLQFLGRRVPWRYKVQSYIMAFFLFWMASSFSHPSANTQGLKKTKEQMPWVTTAFFSSSNSKDERVGYSEQYAEAAFIGKTTAGWRCWSLVWGSVFPVETDGCRLMKESEQICFWPGQ